MTAGPEADRYWMEQTLALAALAEGTTSPNPRVGCLLVRDGMVIGRGLHRAAGQPHAEALALAAAGDARGATAYVNLEPCAHEGRTPPCTEMLLAGGVQRVVAAMRDPDPRVDGRGFARLRAAGCEVVRGPLEVEAERLNDSFVHFHRTGRPLVTLKAAVTLDGMIAAAGGASRWITGAPARRFAHRLRLRHDAILVGAGTVRRDDPRLTVRLPGVSAPRLRVVLAPGLDLDPEAALFGDAGPPARVYCSQRAPRSRARALRRAEVARVPDAPEGLPGLDLRAVLADLGSLGVQSVLVEGGGRTFAGFLAAGVADRAAWFVASRLIGARGGTPLLDRPSVSTPSLGWSFEPSTQLALGADMLLLGRLVGPPGGG